VETETSIKNYSDVFKALDDLNSFSCNRNDGKAMHLVLQLKIHFESAYTHSKSRQTSIEQFLKGKCVNN